jgi:23S rRNA pseudouridine1911/1915/1917 synthase
MAVVPPSKGRAAVTIYKTLKSFDEHTFLEVHPITGRTHQIRLHLAFLGCPVVGDRIYGRRHPSLKVSRQLLHAARLKLVLPGEEAPREFEAPLPEDLEKVLGELLR